MTYGLFPSALRELRESLTARPVIIGMLALGIVLGVSGPFDTLRILSTLPRIAYWITVVVLTFATGSLASTVVHMALRKRTDWVVLLLSTCAVGFAVTVTLTVLNFAAFGLWPDTWGQHLSQLGIVTLISGVVEVSIYALRTNVTSEAAEAAPVLERLPLNKRGALIGLSAEDHYVRVTTAKGEELILMRFSDALREIGSTPGLQIHRSHWVALGQIVGVTRAGDRGEVTLTNGAALPISRGYMPAVREAGLMPRRGKS